jgi:hypothetical protein
MVGLCDFLGIGWQGKNALLVSPLLRICCDAPLSSCTETVPLLPACTCPPIARHHSLPSIPAWPASEVHTSPSFELRIDPSAFWNATNSSFAPTFTLADLEVLDMDGHGCACNENERSPRWSKPLSGSKKSG